MRARTILGSILAAAMVLTALPLYVLADATHTVTFRDEDTDTVYAQIEVPDGESLWNCMYEMTDSERTAFLAQLFPGDELRGMEYYRVDYYKDETGTHIFGDEVLLWDDEPVYDNLVLNPVYDRGISGDVLVQLDKIPACGTEVTTYIDDQGNYDYFRQTGLDDISILAARAVDNSYRLYDDSEIAPPYNWVEEHNDGTGSVFNPINGVTLTGGNTYQLLVWIKAFDGRYFAPDAKVRVNGIGSKGSNEFMGDRYIGYVVIDVPIEHDYGDWEIITPATDTTSGLKRRYCSGCDAYEEKAIPKLSDTTVYLDCGEGHEDMANAIAAKADLDVNGTVVTYSVDPETTQYGFMWDIVSYEPVENDNVSTFTVGDHSMDWYMTHGITTEDEFFDYRNGLEESGVKVTEGQTFYLLWQESVGEIDITVPKIKCTNSYTLNENTSPYTQTPACPITVDYDGDAPLSVKAIICNSEGFMDFLEGPVKGYDSVDVLFYCDTDLAHFINRGDITANGINLGEKWFPIIEVEVGHEWGPESVVQEATCTDYGIYSHKCKVCSDTHQYEVDCLEHEWEFVDFEWIQSSSGYACYAMYTCLKEAEGNRDYGYMDVTCNEYPATCDSPARKVYSAESRARTMSEFNDIKRTAEKTVEQGQALGHDWGEVTYTWADDNSTVTAKRVCTRDESHYEEETVAATGETTPATIYEAGKTVYTSEAFENEAFEVQTKEVPIDKLQGYTITLDPGDGEGEASETLVDPAVKYEVPECAFTAPTEYLFDGWKCGDDVYQPGDLVDVTGDMTFTAQWKAKVWNISVGGVAVSAANCDDVLGDGGSVKYDVSTNTLTLTDATIEMSPRDGVNEADEFGIRYNVKRKTGFTIVLNGENRIVDKVHHSEDALCVYGIAVFKADSSSNSYLDIKGDGSLTISFDSGEPSPVMTETPGELPIQRHTDYTGIQSSPDATISGVAITVEMDGDATNARGVNCNRKLTLTEGASLRVATGDGEGTLSLRAASVAADDDCYVDLRSGASALNSLDGMDAITSEFELYVNDEDPDGRLSAWDGETGINTFKRIVFPHYHDEDGVVYEWADDNKTVTAYVTCINCTDHLGEETVDTTTENTAPGCETPGYVKYTAVFEDERYETQTKKVKTEDAIGHFYEVEYTWSDDNSKVTAVKTCKNDPSHNGTETVKTTSKVTKKATVDSEGIMKYTSASFKDGAFTVQTKEVKIPKLDPTPSPSGKPSPSPSGKPTPAPEEDTGVGGFIDRLYDKVLGRKADDEGKKYWISQVRDNGKTGADIAKGFLYSKEFLDKDMADGDFLEILYNVFFDRASDKTGKDYWLGKMAGGMSKQDVIMGFINSTEWANVCLTYGIPSGGTGKPSITIEPNEKIIAFATRLYSTCLGRKPEPAGLKDWSSRLANMQVSGTKAAEGFFFSSEFLGHNFDNAEFITRLYRTFMDREPDQGGYDYWMGRLSSGATRMEVFKGFADSKEFAKICSDYGILR